MMIDFLNLLITAVAGLVLSFLSLLPDSPFQGETFAVVRQYMGYLNYFIPVGRMVGFLGVYLSAVLVWYGVRYVLRVTHYIQ